MANDKRPNRQKGNEVKKKVQMKNLIRILAVGLFGGWIVKLVADDLPVRFNPSDTPPAPGEMMGTGGTGAPPSGKPSTGGPSTDGPPMEKTAPSESKILTGTVMSLDRSGKRVRILDAAGRTQAYGLTDEAVKDLDKVGAGDKVRFQLNTKTGKIKTLKKSP